MGSKNDKNKFRCIKVFINLHNKLIRIIQIKQIRSIKINCFFLVFLQKKKEIVFPQYQEGIFC